MKKDEFVSALAAASGESKASVSAVLGAMAGVANSALASGKSVTIPGVGKIDAAHRAAREVRNPQTGEKKMAPAHKAPRFKFSAPFKATVKG